MKTRITIGIIILAAVFGMGTFVKKTQGHCFWDVYVHPWTLKKSWKTVAALDVRYKTCASPGYYTGWGKVRVTVNEDPPLIHGGTIWADLTREQGEHETHGTTGEYKIRVLHPPWTETLPETSPTEDTLLSMTPRP